MKRFIKAAALLPIVIGAVIGSLLFTLGNADDAPGLSFIGLVAGFLLIMWGIHNSGVIKKGFFVPILLLCFGFGGIVFSVALLLDGEFEDVPGLGLMGIILGIILIGIGTIRFRTLSKKR